MTLAKPRPREHRSLGSITASVAGALLTPHGIDRYLELVHPMLVRSETRGEVTAVRNQTEDTVTLSVRMSKRWAGFSSGQYVRVSVDIDGVRRTRCYSPANSESSGDSSLELTLKVDPEGLVSRYLHRHAAPGMILGISPPDGNFTLPERDPNGLVLISGGSGITPVMSMLRTLCDAGRTENLVFIHYARTAQDVLYHDELARLDAAHPGLRVVLGYTHATHGADIHGFFRREHLEEHAPWWPRAETYLCGPDGLMNAVHSLFETEGFSEQLHTESFTPPELHLDTESATGQVRFVHSGTETTNSGRPLLEQAEEAGLRPEHGCRMGICFSCTTVKENGCVRNALTGELSTESGEEIQTCVSVPVGDVDINC